MKKLTDDGIEEIEIEIPKKDHSPKDIPEEQGRNSATGVKMLPKKIAQERAVDKFNSSDTFSTYGLRAMKKSTYIWIWIAIGILLLFLTIGMIWSISAFNDKDFTPHVTNNIAPANVTSETNNQYDYLTNNKNNFTINIEVGEEISELIANQVIDIINDETNSS